MKTLHKSYFTSDWHVGHQAVLTFDQRPFLDLGHMHAMLVANYNATVGAQDTCYFLGDMGLCSADLLKSVVTQLNGTKVLVLGNHDRGAHAMRQLGFDVVLNMATVILANEIVTMTHCPLRGVWREDVTGMKGAVPGENWHKESKHEQFSIPDFGQFHIHGHTHKMPKDRTLGRQMDVGVRANNYRPVSNSFIEKWISAQKRKEKGSAT